MADDTLNQLNLVIRDVFVDDDIVVGRASTAEEVEGWDSLSHARLIMEIERRFGVRFAPGEAIGLANVGELVDAIDAKAGA